MSNKLEAKLAPIFDIKANKKCENVLNIKSICNKRKKKSTKSENKNKKIIKKFDTNCVQKDSELSDDDCRRSKRLKDKVVTKESIFSYNEDTDEEISCDKNEINFVEDFEENIKKTIDSVEENSNTIDYWIDCTSGQQSQRFEDTDEDIEVVYANNTTNGSQESVTVLTDSQSAEEQKACLLWTEKYKPTTSSEVIGHNSAVNRLKSWLEDWNKKEPMSEADSEDDSDADNCLDETNACLLICGPTGSGKTSMIYAMAEELKYEVLELNASMKRNGRIISRILGEATQSHHMQRNGDSNGATPNMIESFFTPISNINKVENDIKIEKEVKKSKPKGILNYFAKQTNNSVKSSSITEEIEIIEAKESKDKTEVLQTNESTLKSKDKLSIDCSIFTPKVLSFATKSLILFDDIDVMIDEDYNGFWSAVNRINATTKKPVIMTATQFVPYIKDCVNRLQVLSLNKPNDSQTVKALKSICAKELAESQPQLSESVFQYLSTTYDNDIRRCINELQFGWNDWQHIEECEPKTEETIDEKRNTISYYNSVIFADIMQTKFNISSDLENRELWMKGRPTAMENETHTIALAKDIVRSVNGLNHKINKTFVKTSEFRELEKPIDCQTIESISQYFTPNTSLRAILLDYCPYISFICESESIRQSQIANHSRRSRRFMHYLDSIGFYIDNTIRTKLISAFISNTIPVPEVVPKEVEPTVCIRDDDFYD